MDLVQECSIFRFESGGLSPATDKVITEVRVELNINDGLHRVALLCLPRDLEALAVGFLVGEGLLHRREDLVSVEVAAAEARVDVRGRFDASALEAMARRWTRSSGCGGGGTGRDLVAPTCLPLEGGPAVRTPRLLELAADFHARPSLWRETGGVHACGLAGPEGLIAFAEDVGRHNAFDKVVGQAFLDGRDVSDKIVLTTGRISAEIVSKAVACRAPLLVSRSAVTSLAVRLARRFNLTLVGFLRGRRLNVYTGYQRVIAGTDQSAGETT